MDNNTGSTDLIVKDNRLIVSKYHLTLAQIKFISFMSSQIKKDDKDFHIYSFRINDILDVLGMQRVHYKRLRISLRELMTKYIVLEDSEYDIKETTFLSFFHIDKKHDLINMRFDKSLKPFLLQLNKKFTKLSLNKILRFNSQYTIRMYEIIESKSTIYDAYKNISLLKFEYEIDGFKEMMVGDYNYKSEQIEIPKSYRVYNNFKRKVLDICYNELKEKGDYYFEYETIKTGRKVTALRFTIHKNGEKIKKDFKEKKRQFLLKGEEKQLVAEQIKRMMARQGDKIRDKFKYEQKMMQLLKYDKDLQEVKDELDKRALAEMFNHKGNS